MYVDVEISRNFRNFRSPYRLRRAGRTLAAVTHARAGESATVAHIPNDKRKNHLRVARMVFMRQIVSLPYIGPWLIPPRRLRVLVGHRQPVGPATGPFRHPTAYPAAGVPHGRDDRGRDWNQPDGAADSRLPRRIKVQAVR